MIILLSARMFVKDFIKKRLNGLKKTSVMWEGDAYFESAFGGFGNAAIFGK
jgi:hypothetical protein